MVLIKKEYKTIEQDTGDSNDFKIDYIYFKLKIKNQIYNFINCYKPPNQNDNEFLDELENLIYSFNSNDALFIIGDLNMNLLKTNETNNLSNFMENNLLTNYVTNPTRIATIEKNYQLTQTETLIDVIIHNDQLITNCHVVECPFSDHCFVLINIKIAKQQYQLKTIMGRHLTNKNLNKIYEHYDKIDFSALYSASNPDTKWLIFKEKILDLLNKIAPEVTIIIKTKDYFPWIDNDLLYIRHLRDAAYKNYIRNNKSILYYELYKDFRSFYDKKYNTNMIEYFKTQTSSDFKNSKKFWQFYSTYINIKSDKSSETSINSITYGHTKADNPYDIGNVFNMHFTSLSSTSNANMEECFNFATQNINFVKMKLNINNSIFKFHKISFETVLRSFFFMI